MASGLHSSLGRPHSRIRRALLPALALLAALHAQAQPFPSQPLQIVHGTPAGSGVDVLARVIAEPLSADLGQPVVVHARPGADGAIAARAVAAAAPDGHVLMIATRSQMVLNAILKREPGYDATKDFAPILLLGLQPTLVSVHVDVPAATLREFVDYARARPGALNYGAGSANYMFIAETLLREAGVNVVHVPFTGNPPVANAVAAGEVQIALTDVATVSPAARAGRVRILAIIAERRWPSLPEVPTLAEAGFRPIEAPVWLGLYAPAGTPPDRLARIQASVTQALTAAATRERLVTLGFDVAAAGPDALGALQVRDLARSKILAKELGVAGR